MRTKQQRVHRKEKYLYDSELTTNELRQLLGQGQSDPNEHTFGFNALHRSVSADQLLERFEILMVAGTDVNSRSEHPHELLWYTPLHLLIVSRNEMGVIQFIQTAKKYGKDLDYNVQDRQGNTALLLAIKMQLSDTVDILLKENTINVDLPDLEENTPLHYACVHFQVETIHKLLEKSANASIQNSEGKTPLQLLLNPKFNTLLNTETLEKLRLLLIQQMKQDENSLNDGRKVTNCIDRFNL